MTPASAPGVLLVLLAPALTAGAGLSALARLTRPLMVPLLVAALLTDASVSLGAGALSAELGRTEQTLLTWSPLGLYGVAFAIRWGADLALLTAPALLLAWFGVALAERRRRWFGAAGVARPAGRVAACAALVSIAGALWVARAADFVSLYLGLSLYFVCSAVVLGAVAGLGAGGRRAVVAYVCLTGALASILILGRVNGHFQLSGLSTSGFTGVAFFGLALAATFAAAVPPFHGWVTRGCRQPLMPALAAAGGCVAAGVLLVAFRTVELQEAWQAWLRIAGWLAALVGTAISITRRRAEVGLAAAAVARAGLLFLAASVATPASLSAAIGTTLVCGTALGVLWLTAVHPWGGQSRARAPLTRPVTAPGFWVNLLMVATAAGLPPTMGGLMRTTLTSALTSWPSGDQLLRVPLFVADLAVLLAGSALLWNSRYLPPLRGAPGWLAVTALAGVLCVPAIVPHLLVAPWLGPAAAAVAGTASPPLRFDGAPLPAIPSAALALVAARALVQRLRGREWLPALGRAVMGAAVLGWIELRRRARERGLSGAPAAIAGRTWERFQVAAERAMPVLRPFEERYYAGAAILLAVAIIFVVGR